MENAIDQTNKLIGKQVLVKVPMGNEFSFSVTDEDGTSHLAKFTADEQLRYLEAKYPKTLRPKHFERVITILVEILPAMKRMNR